MTIDSGPIVSEANTSADRCRALEDQLAKTRGQLAACSERLYAIEQHYSSEHFKLAESMRDLRTERMRVAGANAGRNIILQRCRALQDRIAELKARLRGYENVEDWHFDDAPIVIDESASQG